MPRLRAKRGNVPCSPFAFPSNPVTILCVGGGSIGHVAPCVAVARALLSLDPPTQVHFACSEREEEWKFLEEEDLPLTTLPLPRWSLSLPLTLLRNALAARNLLRTIRPNAVFCKGGALSIPLVLQARRWGIPVILHDSDAVMGRASRFLAHWATTICLGMDSPESARSPKSLLTGNPVRPEILSGKRVEGLRIMGFSGVRPILLVTGGSQGAESINRTVVSLLPLLLPLCDVAHITGHGKTSATPQLGYWSAPLLHETYPHVIAAATLALSRGGANSINELSACGIPALLVPLEGLAQDHQRANALVAAESGGFIAIRQADLQRELIPTVRQLLEDPDTLNVMGQKARTICKQDAAEVLARIILKEARSP